MSSTETPIYLLIWIVCGIATIAIANAKGATGMAAWFLVGLLLGPIGILLALIGAKPPVTRPRPGPGWTTAGGAPTPVAAQRPDLAATIGELAALRDKGVITEEEFTTKKRELLDRL